MKAPRAFQDEHDLSAMCDVLEQGHMADDGTYMTLNLDEIIPSAQLQDGFMLRGCLGEEEVMERAEAQYRAFDSKATFEQYKGRFRNFMRSPVYQPESDIVAVAPDRQIGAFCIAWTNPVNKVRLFEPVGTHPDFQRRGLGRAVLLEGLHRLQEHGMQSAIVSVLEDNLAAIKLYESVGFQVEKQLGTYEKDV
ncbi:MAG: GNAT family N-acetyltransferase [Anaerolineales bacterium]